ncbi:MAG TPA: hypothetical protein VF061_05340 [Gemmatimonadales bacterium]|jgi:hypothetical protein
MRHILTILALAAGWPAAAAAQRACFPGPESNEARTLAIFGVPLAFSRGNAPTLFSGFQAGLELASLPEVDDAIATPTICEPGKGPENTDLLFALPRPRIGMPLPFGLALQLSWVPPVRVRGVKANLFGVSVEKAFGRLDGLVGAIRAHATFGSVRAPVTCDDTALEDAESECFRGRRSDDRLRPNIMGIDLALGGPLLEGRLRPYGGVGYNRLQPRFQVNFIDQFGQLDDRRVEVDLNRLVLFGGATWQATERVGITTELYGSPADAMTARVLVRTAVWP